MTIYSNFMGAASSPAIPVQFTADDATVAVPVANNLNIFSNDSTANNVNGIHTTVNPNGSDNFYVLLTNRLQGTVNTVGAVTSAIVTFTPTVIGTYAIEARIAAYNTTGSIGAGYSVFGTVRFDGVNSNLCGTPDKIVNEEGAMSAANVTMTVSGANVLLNGVGYAAQTIKWSAVGLYTFQGV
jgi:hypothetical protein